jgi:lysophospholipase L1-like esterase
MKTKKIFASVACVLTLVYLIISWDVSDIPYNPAPENITWESVYPPAITAQHYSTLCFGTITLYSQEGKWRDGCNVYEEVFETPIPGKQWIFIFLIIYKIILVVLWIIALIYAVVTVPKMISAWMQGEIFQQKKIATPVFGRATVWAACFIVAAFCVSGYWTVPFLIGVPDYIWMFLKGEHYLMLQDMQQAQEIFSRLAMVHTIVSIAGKIAVGAAICFGAYRIIQKIIRLVPSFKTHVSQYRNLRNTMMTASCFGALIGLVVAEVSMRKTELYALPSEIQGQGFISSWSPVAAAWGSPFAPGELSPQKTESFHYPPKKANNEGILDYVWNRNRSDSTKRIMCMGDSFMEGRGASLDSSCPRILETLLPQNTEVFNAGISGRDIFSEYMLLKESLLAKYRPNVVIVSVSGNEASAVTYGGLERFGPGGQIIPRQPPWYETLYGHSHLIRAIAKIWFGCDVQTHLPPVQLAYEQQLATRKIQECMDAYVRLCTANNMTCIFCIRPDKGSFGIEDLQLRELKMYLEKKRYAYVDLFEYFKDKQVPNNFNEYYWEQDGHCTPKGYATMAEGIAISLTKPRSHHEFLTIK